MLKNFRFWHVLPSQSVRIFYTSLLPLRVRISKIDVYPKALAYPFMASEFGTIVCRYRLDMPFEWRKQMYDSTCQFLGILSLRKFSHKQHVCTALYQRHDSAMISFPDDSVHLEVPKTLAVCIGWSLADACSIGYGHTFVSQLQRPLTPLLRLISRDTVLGLAFIALAISFCFILFWSSTEIVYLCSEVNCLYITMQI